MNYIELNRRILTALRKKLYGEGRVEKVSNEKAIPGIEYTMNTMKTISDYYALIDDDEERRAKNIYHRTVKVLHDKLNGSKRVNALEDENVEGIKFSLVVMNNQRKYLFHTIQKAIENK